MEKTKIITRKVSTEINRKLTQVSEYEDVSKSTLLVRELKQIVSQWEREKTN